MPRVVWSESAVRDLQRAYHFLAEKNVDMAKRAVKAIRSGVRVIARHPEIGRPVGGMKTEYREWLIDFGDTGYIAMYRYDGHESLIVAVRHQREAGYL